MKELIILKNIGTLIDDEDYEKLSKFQWRFDCGRNSTTYYAITYIDGKRISMHRMILNINDKKIIIDHKNGDGLDNRKENLRICSNSQNIANSKIRKDNTSGYKGVCFCKLNNKWKVRISFNKKRIILGYFENIKEAAYG